MLLFRQAEAVLGILLSLHGTPYRWKSVAIVAGGFVSGIDFSPVQKGLAYVRTDIGGAYRWDAKTGRWIPLQDWLTKKDWNLYGVESIGVDPVDPNRVYLACGTYTNSWGGNGAILRSNDQGRTFRRTDLPFKNGGNEDGRSIGERLAVDPHDHRILFFGTRNRGLWRSSDFGAAWRRVDSFPMANVVDGIGLGFVVFDPSSRTIYVGADHGLYKSTNGGKTWASVRGEPTGLIPCHAFLTRGGLLYITYANGPGPNGVSGGAVWKLDTKTGAWTDITPVKPNSGSEGGFGYAGLTVDPNHPGTLMVSTMDRWNPGDDVFRSRDFGKTWIGLRAKSHRNSSLSPYVTWNAPEAKFGWWIGALALDPFHPETVLYGTGATIWGTDEVQAADLGQATNWRVRALGIEETADIELLSPLVGPHLISGLGDIGGFTHDDLDRTPAGGMTLNPMLGNTDSIAEAGLKPEIVARVGRGDGVLGGYSTDAGETWTAFPSAPSGTHGSGSIAVTANGEVLVWAPSDAVPYTSADFGRTWSASTGAGQDVQLVADPVLPSRVYAIENNGNLLVSEDSGSSFQPAATGLPAKHGRLRSVFGVAEELWLPTDSGLFRSTDGGTSFAKLPGVGATESVGFGKPAPGHSHPAVFLNGQVNGHDGVFRSDDAGKTWRLLTDPAHEYGTRGIITGDPRIYGRVYVGTNGRGILYADPH